MKTVAKLSIMVIIKKQSLTYFLSLWWQGDTLELEEILFQIYYICKYLGLIYKHHDKLTSHLTENIPKIN